MCMVNANAHDNLFNKVGVSLIKILSNKRFSQSIKTCSIEYIEECISSITIYKYSILMLCLKVCQNKMVI